MHRFIKIAAFAAVFVGLVTVSLLVLAKFLITPERVRRTVLPIAEKSLNRPVSIGEIDVRLFSGIALKDFSVRSTDGKTDFISADALILTYRVWPLFLLRVVIDEARLDGPSIRAARFKNGEFNFSDLFASEMTVSDQKPDESPPPESNGDGPVFEILINELAITNGKLEFTDRMIAGDPLTHQFDNLTVAATNISPAKAFPVSVESRINGAPFSLQGTVDPQLQAVDLRLVLKAFNVSGLMPYMAGSFPGTLTSMALDVNASISGDMKALTTSGQVEASRVDLKLDALPDAPLENAEARLSYKISVNLELEKLSIHRAEAVLNGIPLSLSGTVENYASKPNLDLHAALPMTPLATLIKAMPEKMVEPVAAMNPKGQVAADMQLAGDPNHPQTLIRKGRVTFDALGFTRGDLPVRLDGRIEMEKDSARGEGLNIRFADSPAVLNFTAANIMGKPIRISHDLHARALNLDEILSASGGRQKLPPKKTPSEPVDSKSPPPPQPTGPIDLPLRVDGTVRVDNAVYQGLALSDFELFYLLANNLLEIKKIRGDVAGGTISGTGQADLNQKFITYGADMAITGTQANRIVSAIFPRAADTLFGNLFLKFNLNGQGLDSAAILNSLTGNADLKITDGRLTGTGLTKGLAAFLDTEKLEVLSFSSVSGIARLVNGNIEIDSDYTGSEVRMAPKGKIGLDGSVDLSLNLQLAPGLAARIDGNELVSRLLQNQEGWAVIPLNVAGSLFSPRFSLDTTIVRQMLQEKASQELQQQIRERLFKQEKKKQPPAAGEKSAPEVKPEEEEKQPSLNRMLEESLKKLVE